MTYLFAACALFFAILLIRANKKKHAAEEYAGQLASDFRIREKEQRKRQTREIQRLLDALPYPFFSISGQGKIIRCNRHASRIFETREVLNRSIRQVFLDDAIVKLVKRVIKEPSPHRGTIRLPPDSVFSQESDDKDSHWEVDLRPLALESDSLEFQLMMRDITASVHADQVRQDFVANASHELRTPLSIISGYLENLTEEDGLDNKELARKMLDTMDRHVIRINRIVEDMLVISRLESGEAAPLKISTFNLASCVRDVCERLELVVTRQDAKLNIEVPELELVGDHFYWTQVLFNLVENALKQNANLPVKVSVKTQQGEDGTIAHKGH